MSIFPLVWMLVGVAIGFGICGPGIDLSIRRARPEYAVIWGALFVVWFVAFVWGSARLGVISIR